MKWMSTVAVAMIGLGWSGVAWATIDQIPAESPGNAQPAPAPGGAPAAAPAEEEDDVRGFELGARLGYQLPMGKLGAFTSNTLGFYTSQDTAMTDVIGGGVDLILDVGHRVSRAFYYGFLFSYAPSLATPNCSSGCSVNNIRAGMDFLIHPRFASDVWDPFFGFGVDYDQLTFSAGSQSFNFYGMEFLDLQAGVDFLAMPNVSLGAFLGYSFGMYFGGDHVDTKNAELHDWMTLGVRGAFRL